MSLPLLCSSQQHCVIALQPAVHYLKLKTSLDLSKREYLASMQYCRLLLQGPLTLSCVRIAELAHPLQAVTVITS